MRVALLLSGKFRGSYIPFNYLQTNLLNKYNPDIFINYNYKDDNDMECDESELVSIYNPKLINFTKTPDIVGEKISIVNGYEVAGESSPSSVFNMWWGIYQANELKKKYEEENGFKYDVVIRTRFDIEILEEVALRNWNESLFIPMGSDHRDGFNDFLAYGKSHIMDYYCSNFHHLVDYIKGGELIHPERLLRRHLQDFKCTFIRTYMPMRLRGVLVNHIDYSVNP
jgi:hypothetical protein